MEEEREWKRVGRGGRDKGAKRVKVGEGITVGKGSWNKGGS